MGLLFPEALSFSVSLEEQLMALGTQKQATEAKTDKWDCIKPKNFSPTKGTINREKANLWKRQKISASYIHLIMAEYQYYIKNSYSSTTKAKQRNFKMCKGLQYTFLQRCTNGQREHERTISTASRQEM
jgi:hypothetical protein